MQALGAQIHPLGGKRQLSGRLSGARVYLDLPSVGATENLMMAAALARGLTVLENAAKEPEIVDLANCLNQMGASISGAGTETITILGVERLHGAVYRPIPDRIEAGTLLCAAAVTEGSVLVRGGPARSICVPCCSSWRKRAWAFGRPTRASVSADRLCLPLR